MEKSGGCRKSQGGRGDSPIWCRVMPRLNVCVCVCVCVCECVFTWHDSQQAGLGSYSCPHANVLVPTGRRLGQDAVGPVGIPIQRQSLVVSHNSADQSESFEKSRREVT